MILGHKGNEKLLTPILEQIPDSAKVLVEPFGGSGVISAAAKQLGLKVILNDIRRIEPARQTHIHTNLDHPTKLSSMTRKQLFTCGVITCACLQKQLFGIHFVK